MDSNLLHLSHQLTPRLQVTGDHQATQQICRKTGQLILVSDQDLLCQWRPDHLTGRPAEPLLGLVLMSMEQPCLMRAMHREGHLAEPHCQPRSALCSPPLFALVMTMTRLSLTHCPGEGRPLLQCLVIQAATDLGLAQQLSQTHSSASLSTARRVSKELQKQLLQLPLHFSRACMHTSMTELQQLLQQVQAPQHVSQCLMQLHSSLRD